MKEVKGNLWDYHKAGNWVVITTNGSIRKDGACVMGRGVALQAKQMFPKLPYELGELIKIEGNKVLMFGEYKILTLPVKHQWFEVADLKLIEEGLQELSSIDTSFNGLIDGTIYLVRPGCDNGKRDWETEVKPLCEKYLTDRFVIVEIK